MEHYEAKLAPLPCWQGASPGERRKRITQMVREIEAEAAMQRAELGIEPLGREAIRNWDPFA
ncbi:MAG: hypothetical protein AAF560_31505 [Acidobacteriota bacterium]